MPVTNKPKFGNFKRPLGGTSYKGYTVTGEGGLADVWRRYLSPAAPTEE